MFVAKLEQKKNTSLKTGELCSNRRVYFTVSAEGMKAPAAAGRSGAIGEARGEKLEGSTLAAGILHLEVCVLGRVRS